VYVARISVVWAKPTLAIGVMLPVTFG